VKRACTQDDENPSSRLLKFSPKDRQRSGQRASFSITVTFEAGASWPQNSTFNPEYGKTLITPVLSVLSRSPRSRKLTSGRIALPTLDHVKTRPNPSKNRWTFTLGRPTQDTPTTRTPLSSVCQRSCWRRRFTTSSNPACRTVTLVSPPELSPFFKSASVGTRCPSGSPGFGVTGSQVPSKHGPCSTLVQKVLPSS